MIFSTLFSLFSFLFVLPPQAAAWGSITHSAICREAGGSEGFIMGGVAPDMIALHAVTTGDESYSYTHNCYGDSLEPVFGNILASILSSGFASGWKAHQLADSIVHCPGGYSISKTLLRSLPGAYGSAINHGAVELVVDAIVLGEYFHDNVSIYVPEQSELIHNGTIKFYNENLRSSRSIPRGNIISCQKAQDLGFAWQNCLQANILLASLLTDETWFPSVREDMSDYRAPYERSIALVNGASARREVDSGWLRVLVDCLVPPRIASAAETESNSETNTYYSFLNEVSKRAREIGGGKATKESTRQAVEELSRDRSIPAEQRAWAEAMNEMTNGKSKTREELEANISGRLLEGRDGSAKGAEGGRRISLLPYLPCSAGIFLTVLIIVWLIRFKRR